MKNIKSIQTQFILISVVIILVALGTVGAYKLPDSKK